MDRTEAAALLRVAHDASPRQVRSAFRKRVRADHPDRKGAQSSDTSNIDFQRLVEARDLLLTPAPAPIAEPEPEPPRPPTQPKTTLTYGYDPYKGPEREEFVTRAPRAPLGTQAKPRSLLVRIRRLGWQVIAMGVLAFAFFQFVIVGIINSPTCVGRSAAGPVEVACINDSDLEIVAKRDRATDVCPAGTERFAVGDGLWCVAPHG